MQKSWKSTVAGILAIIGGAVILLFATIICFSLIVAAPSTNALILAALFGGFFLALGIVAIVGGISALQRRRWGLALAGSICALMPPATMLGIASIVFTTIARDDFSTVPSRQLGASTEESSPTAGTCSRTTDFGGPSEGERNA